MEMTALDECSGVGELLAQLGDKWTVRVVITLLGERRRFNDIKRRVAGISQQMLARTLKHLERDGLAARTVHATSPVQVDYALTPLGESLAQPLHQLAAWAIDHRAAIRDHRLRYDDAATGTPR